MRALVIAPRMPEFDREGGSRRIFHLIELLCEEGWAVTFVAHDDIETGRYARVLRRMGVATFGRTPTSPTAESMRGLVGELVARSGFDLAVLAFWPTGEDFLPIIRAHSPRTRVVIDSIDLHFLRQSRGAFLKSAEPGVATLDARYADEMRRELNVYGASDAVLTVSNKEAELINDFTGARRAFAMPDMDEMPASCIPFSERRGVVFVGNFRHPPNADAVEYFFEEILPRVDPAAIAGHPVYVVGNDLSPALADLARPFLDARMVGWVPSVTPYLERARVSILPLRYGAGTKRKLIQAAMVGTPSVSTSIGTEGLGLEHAAEVLVADDADAFARAIEDLLTDEALWQTLSKKGRERVLVSHGREVVRTRLNAVLSMLMEPNPAPAQA